MAAAERTASPTDFEPHTTADSTPDSTARQDIFEIVRNGPDTRASSTAQESRTAWSTEHAREIARRKARAIPEEAVRALFREHDELTEQMFERELSRRETARLTYVRWQLDRVEDAKIGAQLDTLETLASLQEAIAEDVERFVAEVKRAKRPARNTKRMPRGR